jgi:FkbM family methyltransferase
MLQPKTALDVRLGFPAVEVPSPFDIRRHTKPNRGALVGGEPLTIQSDRKAWSSVLSFPAREHAFESPSGDDVFCWVTRVEARLVSGSAVLAHASPDGSRYFDQVVLNPHTRQFHVLMDAPVAEASLMVRHGATPGLAELQISGFRCFGLIDDRQLPLAPPDQLRLAPMVRWSRFYGDPSDDPGERARCLRFRTLGTPRLMTWLEGLEILLVPDEDVSRAVYVSGVYEPCTASVLRRVLHDGATFVDVGANVGLLSMLASRWIGPRGTVIAFEPSQRECSRLRHHLDRNSLGNVRVLKAAAGRKRGTAVLRVADARHTGLNTLQEQFVYPEVKEAYSEEVPVLAIDDAVREHNLEKVHVIKIDVEGGEHHVVAGARQTIARDRPTMLIEMSGAAAETGHPGRTEIEGLLGSLGYSFLAIDGDTGTLRHTAELTGPAENFVAAMPEVIAALSPEAWGLGPGAYPQT